MREKNFALKLHCILPYEGQADRWSDSARERYHSILKQAESVEYVSRQYYDGCMIDRNHRLVETADLLLAMFNGARRSGTGATVNYARRLGREIIVIEPITRQIHHEETASPRWCLHKFDKSGIIEANKRKKRDKKWKLRITAMI